MESNHVVPVAMDDVLNNFIAKLRLPPARYYLDNGEAAVKVTLADGRVKTFRSNEWDRALVDKKYHAARDAIKWIEKEMHCELVDFNHPSLQRNKERLRSLMVERNNRAGLDDLLLVQGRKLLAEVIVENRRLKEEVEPFRWMERNEQ